MRFLRWIASLFSRPRQGLWRDAVLVTDPNALARLDRIYAAAVAWVRVRRPDAVIAPKREVALRIWPKGLRAPDDFGIGKVLAPFVIVEDEHGTLLLNYAWQNNEDLIFHECKHCVTGESGHPPWLFPNG